MKDQIIQMWNRCSDRLPEEDGKYLLYIPEPYNTQVIADYLDGIWFIPKSYLDTPMIRIKCNSSDCLWTCSTQDPEEDTIN